MNLLFLREKFGHMGNHSGYDLLFQHLSHQMEHKSIWRGDKITSRNLKKNHFFSEKLKGYSTGFKHELQSIIQTTRVWESTFHRFKSIIIGSTFPFYTYRSFVSECVFLNELAKEKFDIGHVGYVENNFGLLSKKEIRTQVKGKIVGTVHQPMSWWKLYSNPDNIALLDGIITLSEYECSLWKKIFPDKNIAFIPHGIDSTFFSPLPEKSAASNTFKIIFTGHWLRNMHVMGEIVEKSHEFRNIEFHFILPISKRDQPSFKHVLQKIARDQRVKFYTDLSDLELLEKYRTADIMLMPLIDCTANNAIMEAMSCGLPIVSSDLQSLKSYVSDKNSILLPDDARAYVDSIKSLIESQNKRQEMSVKSREIAEGLSWEEVTADIKDFYNEVLQ